MVKTDQVWVDFYGSIVYFSVKLSWIYIVLYFIKFYKVPNNISIFVRQLYVQSVSEIILPCMELE